MTMTLIQAVAGLLEELEQISRDHEEITDTDVRESLHLALNFCFVWSRQCAQQPKSFGMFSREGDALVSDAFRHFLEAVDESGALSKTSCGQARLDILQAGTARTASGMRYDEFLGHRDAPLPPDPLPEHMLKEGEYDDEEE